MAQDLVSPNWHVILIHYPLGLLGAGVLVELACLATRRHAWRGAGRIMILLGGLLAIPTAVSGLYAFRDTAFPDHLQLVPWRELEAASPWSDEAWRSMTRHAWCNGFGVALIVSAILAWIVARTPWRRRLYAPLLGVLLLGCALLIVGAWFGGEGVYRHGVGVAAGAHGHADETSRSAASPPSEPSCRPCSCTWCSPA